MARAKSERLLNLTFMLLATTRYLTKNEIRKAIEPYRTAPSDSAFERMFERDKDELRKLGLDIETGTYDPFFDDEIGYRIRRDAAELPDVELTAEEAAVVGVAANVWQHEELAGESFRAVVKLKAAGLQIDPSIASVDGPQLNASEPAFGAMLEATATRTPVRFTYQRPGQAASERYLQPWGILSWFDRWYVGGFDVDRGGPRLFRISRVISDVKPASAAGSYDVPVDARLADVAAALFPRAADRVALLRVAEGRAQALRSVATSCRSLEDGWDELEVPFGVASELAAEIASFGTDIVAVAPNDLQDAVIAHLRKVSA